MARRISFFRPTLVKLPFGPADFALLAGLFLLLYAVARVGAGSFVEFRPPAVTPTVTLDTANLPYYAARSTIRMFVALAASLLFTLSYGYACAKSKQAEKLLVPLLDILQSVPVLGFLSVTVTFFIGLFPGSLLGLEFASIFAIFTSQAWNMTFSFYHSLITLPRELDEAASVFHLSKWRRFTAVEVPSSMIGLVWNAMMSFGGGWFFVAASEAISVLNQHYTLPGIGSYVAEAIKAKDLHALGYAVLTMAVVILLVDQLFWRPVVAWSEKFKMERSASAEPPQSWVLDLIRASKLPREFSRWFRRISRKLPKIRLRLPAMFKGDGFSRVRRRRFNDDVVFGVLIGALIVIGLVVGFRFIGTEVRGREVLQCVGLGLLTLMRVTVLLVLATLVWTPIGVAIGFNPRLARISQPAVQFLASFPANFVFPVATVVFLRLHISLNWGSILLMALGAQWYILFNTIAGAMSVPSDLREMAQNMGLRGWPLWKKLIIPAIFPAWVTGAVTASGGAWNASIVAEVVDWGDKQLTAAGLGSYITFATGRVDWPRVVLGVTIMCMFVVGINRLFWRRLYVLAETRYRLG
jgi:NitT/TauT family transport system permease protein